MRLKQATGDRQQAPGNGIVKGANIAERRADFVHKIGLAAKEIRETIFWLRLIQRSSGLNLHDAVREACELAAILVASGRTARDRVQKT